jgi:iron(III) transport system ATP-binding protein
VNAGQAIASEQPADRANQGLVLDDVRHRFGAVEVVKGVSLSVGAGEVVCLLGPSGCGKTTTLRLAAGLERLQHGSVAVAGQVMSTPRETIAPEHRRIGLMFQDFALFPHLTVLDNVAFGLRGQAAGARRQTALGLLERVHLAHLAQVYPHALSGGEQQRVALVRALAPRPLVMLLDEPFSGLDARLRDQIRDDTLSLLKEQGVATLLVTHDAEEALFMADRIALMAEGQLVQVGTPEALYFRPEMALVAGFFGELNQFDGVARSGAVDTPLGRVAAPSLSDGVRAAVMVRAEGIKLGHAGEGSAARVESVRFLGGVSRVTMRLADGSLVRAKLTVERRLEAGECVRLTLDPRHGFVFPSSMI